jgi:uncharacterized membrane protein (Fun14 family)
MGFLETVTLGGLAGLVSGIFMKRVGIVAAIIAGLVFVTLQILSYYGFITINWGGVEAAVSPVLEPERLRGFWSGFVEVMTRNLPFAAAFVPGFFVGLRF